MSVDVVAVPVLLLLAWLAMGPASSSQRLTKPVSETAELPFVDRIRGPASVVAGLGLGSLTGGLPGVLIGLAASVAAWFGLGYLISRNDGAEVEELALQAPDAIACLVACLAAGTPTWNAVAVVAESFGDPIAAVLVRARSVALMGGTPRDAWQHVDLGSPLAPVARVFIRSSESGTSLTASLTESAQRLRDQRASVIERKAQAIGVRAVLPLGLCFLPAFFVLGVIPLVASLAQTLI